MIILNTLNFYNDSFINRFSENVKLKIDVANFGFKFFLCFDPFYFYSNT